MDTNIKSHIALTLSLTKEAYLLNFFDSNKYDPEYNITRDVEYDAPDYKRNAFYSGLRSDINFYMIDHRNMVTPIKHKPDFLNTISSRDGMKDTLIKYNPTSTVKHVYGVYITEEFIFTRGMFIDTDVLVEYYNNTDYIDMTDITIEQFRADIERVKVIGRSSNHYPDLSFRVTTFIPESVILDNDKVYIPNLDIVLSSNGIGSTTLHPRSKKYKELQAGERVKSTSTTSTTISVELIDNVNYTNKPYYMKLGNEAIAIKSIKRPNEPSGCTITHVNNGSVIDSKYISTDEYTGYGIYNDRESCLANGDNAGYLAIKKLELEHETIQLAYTKLEEDKKATVSKYEHELTKINLSYESMKSENILKDKRAQADIDKLTLDLDKITEERKTLEYKSNMAVNAHDKDVITHKYRHEVNTLLLSKDKLEADLKLHITKHDNDMKILMSSKDKITSELELQNTKYDIDMNILKEESNKKTEEVRVAKRKLSMDLEVLTAKAEQSKIEYRRKIVDAIISTYINIYSQLLNVKQSRIKHMLEQTKLYNDIHQNNVKHKHDMSKLVIDSSGKAINGVIGIVKQLIK